MIIEIICIGNELLFGSTINSNAYWLAGQISRAGGIIKRVTVIPDDIEEISETVKQSLARKPDILITTGGLGATYDDLTLEGVAVALGKRILLDQQAIEMIKRSYIRRNLSYKMTKTRLKMAKIPEGSTPIENPVGSAPAIIEESGKTKIFCMPGVPSEMMSMFQKEVLPIVKEEAGKFVSKEINYIGRGVTESEIAPVLAKIVKQYPRNEIYLKTHPQGYLHRGEKKISQIRIQIISRGSREKEVDKKLNTIANRIKKEISRRKGKIM
jgi:molybdenum cofactor synthesis domain-containing protein